MPSFWVNNVDFMGEPHSIFACITLSFGVNSLLIMSERFSVTSEQSPDFELTMLSFTSEKPISYTQTLFHMLVNSVEFTSKQCSALW